MNCFAILIIAFFIIVTWDLYKKARVSSKMIEDLNEDKFFEIIDTIDDYTERGKCKYAIYELSNLLKRTKITNSDEYSVDYTGRLILINQRLAYNYKYMKNYTLAITYFQKVIKLSQRKEITRNITKQGEFEVNALLEIGNIYNILGEYDKAIEYLSKHEPEVYHRGFEFYIAQCYEEKGDAINAIKYYKIELQNIEMGYTYSPMETEGDRIERKSIIKEKLEILSKNT
ncbi:MAG: tetratricopeptide repeat protein [Cyanobacteriota bacterium]